MALPDQIRISTHTFIPMGEVWCSPDAFEHIKKILNIDGPVRVPSKEELENS